MDVLHLLSDYYGGYDEENRLRSQHGLVEFLTTMRYIETYLRPGMRILEIGAATGRYSHTLARKGEGTKCLTVPMIFAIGIDNSAVTCIDYIFVGIIPIYKLIKIAVNPFFHSVFLPLRII